MRQLPGRSARPARVRAALPTRPQPFLSWPLPRHRATALAAALSALAAAGLPSAPARAQAPGDAAGPVVITGNPLGRERLLQPASVLAGDVLARQRAGTLGETLDGLPGVASTAFGPNAGRPVVRGLDGDRVRLLENGAASVDASNLSFDHAVAIEPLVLDRIEVLRGPAALLYGGSATGGVVNVLHNRVPRRAVDGIDGRAELRFGGAASERAAVAVLDGGAGAAGGLAWHADAFSRRTDDLRVPRFTPLEDGQPLDPADRVRNSASRAEGGALGAGWVGRQGQLGAGVETLRHRYGVTAEPDVTIRLQRERATLAGGWRAEGAGAFVQGIEGELSHTDYRHEEVEGDGTVGTTFKSRGESARLELRHAPLAGWRGVLGWQGEALDFSALGEEAFVPSTRTRSQALFVLEELERAGWTLSAGARVERVQVDAAADPDPGAPRFGPARERRFSPTSLAAGLRRALAPGLEATLQLARTERAPAYYELYADGVHLATAAYERGDPGLGVEKSRHVELALEGRAGANRWRASLYRTSFSNYIALTATGNDIVIPDPDGGPDEIVPEYAFRGVPARLSGWELEGRTRLVDGAMTLDLSGSFDAVRGDDRARGEPLPRLTPRRARIALDAGWGAWQAGAALRHVARQTRVESTDRPTPGHTLLDLWAAWRLPLAPAGQELQLFARLANVADRLAKNATTIATLRDLAPLPGRSLAAGLRWRF